MPKGVLTEPKKVNCVDCGSEMIQVGVRPKRWCEACTKRRDNERSRAYHVANREQANARVRLRKSERTDLQPGWQRPYMLKNRYGLTVEEYDWMLSFQSGVCAICKTAEPNKPLHVDHCHTTGRVRGLLCRRCNMALGAFQDDADRIRRAAAYLIEWQAKHAAMRAAA